jgi:phosphopantothenoylcysteine decarboxylase/phosphopantothenate--cysteine ligase
MTLTGKKIVIGVSGGIAAYKACDLVRQLKGLGAQVRVAMTASARAFVSEMTFATLSETPVASELFEQHEKTGVPHIELARWADLLVVCPATANIIGKVASGIADDFLSTTIMASKARIVFCPAMNSVMWQNAVVQENIAKLQRLHHHFIDPEWGALATTDEGEGWGRLASVALILARIRGLLLATTEFAGKTVVVTAGATREAIDPVRYISNRSSGKMGFALAAAARLRGADVVLIAGRNQLTPPVGVNYIEVETVAEMHNAVSEAYESADVLLMAAAVSDYRPADVAEHKIKKGDSTWLLSLTRTEDILASLKDRKGHRLHVGFALETDNGMASAKKKLVAKNLDLIVLNNPLQPGAAFGGDTNVVTFISRDAEPQVMPQMSKFEVADHILDKVSPMLKARDTEAAVAQV